MLLPTGVILPNKRDNACNDTATENSLALVPVALASYCENKKSAKTLAITDGREYEDPFKQYSLSQICNDVPVIEDTPIENVDR